MVGLGLPRGSGTVESAIRRVINLRIKGASIYWLPESVDAILLLRSFYKSGRWNCLQRMAMTPVGDERVTGKSGMRPIRLLDADARFERIAGPFQRDNDSHSTPTYRPGLRR